jgi:hypothetical protein
MPEHVPVPPAIWKRLLEFLASERSGTITLHVRAGRVRNAVVVERVAEAKGVGVRICPNCKKELTAGEGHFAPPSLGEPGFYICNW